MARKRLGSPSGGAASARPADSKSGSARVTPAAFSNIRRETGPCIMSLAPESRATDDRLNQGAKTIVPRPNLGHDLIDLFAVAEFQGVAGGVHEQLCRQAM